jgi:hypothetical protein
MGIFYKYGTEYGVTLYDGTYITILPIDVLDERWKQSYYFPLLQNEYRKFEQCDIQLTTPN